MPTLKNWADIWGDVWGPIWAEDGDPDGPGDPTPPQDNSGGDPFPAGSRRRRIAVLVFRRGVIP